LAFQYCDKTEDGDPSALAIEGALLHAEQQDTIRSFRKAYLKTK